MSGSIIRFILVTLVCVSCSVHGCNDLRMLQWIIGDWVAEGESSRTIEKWTLASDDTFEGSGETRSLSGKKLNHESLRLVTMQDTIFYLAKVTDNPRPVAFTAQYCSDSRAEFVNLDHDFPQRITYLKTPTGIEVKVSDDSGKGFSLNFVPDKPIAK